MSRLVITRPWLTLGLLGAITVLLGAGASLRVPATPTQDTLPEDSAVAETLKEINALFGDSGETNAVTLIFRGEALTPGGLAQITALLDKLVAHPNIGPLLAPDNAVVSPATLVQAALQPEHMDSVTQAHIDAARSAPGIGEAISRTTGTDRDGTPVAIATIRLLDTGDERIQEAERRIDEFADMDEGPLRVSSISPTVIEDEYQRATDEAIAPLLGLALLLIAALLLLFMRSIPDLLLTLAGLFVALIWIVGAEGWLGPNGLGLTGPPNSLTSMVPIIVISLTVDYAIQAVSHYREQRLAGEPVATAGRIGMRNVTVPLVLAAATTIVSFLASLFSPIAIVGDFGVVAALGVALSLIVMLTLLPAGRTIIDRRREARGVLKPPRPISGALPGAGRAAELLGRSVARRPAPYIVAVLAVTAFLGFAARGLESEFSVRDILPRGGSVIEDMDTLGAAVGGTTAMTNALVRAEATETRTLLNLRDLTAAFEDEDRRPRAAAGPLQPSYESLVRDWTTDSGAPGDRYDPELARLFREASAGVQLDPALMQQVLDRLETVEPDLGHLLINDRGGIDAMLLQFPTYIGDSAATRELQASLEELWLGDDEAITATSDSIISVTIADSLTGGLTEAIGTTVVVAIGTLAIFFWATVRQPTLAVIAVGPVVLVLISVLGTMSLLGIPFSLTTSIIMALSIGIGVDYTIHVVHRYREEFSRARDPEAAAIRTLATTGSALLGSALTTALGLGVLVASPLAALQQFGITAAITIGYSLIFAILVTPPAMTVWGAYQNMRLRSTAQRMSDELDLAIEAVHRRHE